MESLHSYQMSGLDLASEIPLPGLVNRQTSAVTPDVTIRVGAVPASLAGATLKGPTWEIANNRFLLRIPRVASFLLVSGRTITVAPEIAREEVAIFLLGTVMGILLHQRGQIVLHASAVAVNGSAVLFCGPSGAGKSTMAAGLAKHGYSCVSDDLCTISMDAAGRPIVHSDGRQLKLWAHAIKHLELGDRPRRPVREQIEKYYVEHDAREIQPLPLGALYALRETRPPHVTGIERPNLVDSATLVRRNAYRPPLVRRMNQREKYFHAAAAIVGSGGVYQFTRRLTFAELPDSVERLETHWSQIGLLTRGDA